MRFEDQIKTRETQLRTNILIAKKKNCIEQKFVQFTLTGRVGERGSLTICNSIERKPLK